MSEFFDPRSVRCKEPYGAVSTGTRVRISVFPRRSDGVTKLCLHAGFEADDREISIPMRWSGLELSREIWTAYIDTSGYCGLIWYYFETDAGKYGSCGFSENPEKWQLTVYSGYPRAGGFGEGVTYQIFPDRFFSSCEKKSLAGRSLHRSWDEEPDTPEKVTNSDFFGGDLEGIIQKLPYLQSLGVENIYINPVFLSPSNHRYDTADYTKIDPYLGTEEDLGRLCSEAERRGMRIILDGVFSHTGSDSVYFNALGTYPQTGAAQSKDSEYYKWYSFERWPDKYSCWWGIKTLPQVNETEKSYSDFIAGPGGVMEKWQSVGVSGWRLDVADELPDDFIDSLRAAAGDRPLIGEVWEDASNKISYGVRRRYIHTGALDGVMNYPFRDAVLSYALGGDARDFYEKMESLRENYPPYVFYNSMNILGTHDTERVLTALGDEKRVMIAAAVMFAFPGTPTIYYGDEAGLSGGKDPMNRRPYPWGHENESMLSYFRELGALRKSSVALRKGSIRYIKAEGGVLCFERAYGEERVLLAANTGNIETEICGAVIPPLSAVIRRSEQ